MKELNKKQLWNKMAYLKRTNQTKLYDELYTRFYGANSFNIVENYDPKQLKMIGEIMKREEPIITGGNVEENNFICDDEMNINKRLQQNKTHHDNIYNSLIQQRINKGKKRNTIFI